MKTEKEFFIRQEEYKQWILNDKKKYNSNEIHQIEFKYFTENIVYANYNKIYGDWDSINYQEHMIKIAKQVLISSEHIYDMQQKLDFDKRNKGAK